MQMKNDAAIMQCANKGGRKKPLLFTDMSVNGGRGVNPSP